MAPPYSRPTPAGSGRTRWLPLALLAAGLAVLTGCQQDEITHYRVPKVESPAGPAEVKVQLLGAIIPHGNNTWFFKLLGPIERVREHGEAFNQFVQSIRFNDKGDPPLTWKAPEGWRERPGNEVTYAAFRLGPGDDALQVTVTKLGRGGGAADLLANVNRWRGQIGLAPVAEAELEKITKKTEVAGNPVTLVDMVGTGGGAAKMPPFAGGRLPPDHPGVQRPSLKYDKPADWKAAGGVDFSAATFQVTEGSQLARVTMTPLSGPGGGLLENVNRWRRQVGLDSTTEEGLRKEALKVEVGGAAGQYVDLSGPESAGKDRPRILGVVVPRGEQTWFIKMTGPADLVGRQKSAFEAFVKSVRFE